MWSLQQSNQSSIFFHYLEVIVFELRCSFKKAINESGAYQMDSLSW